MAFIKPVVFSVILTLMMPGLLSGANSKNDNVLSPSETTTYNLIASKGKLQSVKVRKEIELIASRTDSKFPVYAGYSEGLTIDKASAPGCKPEYRSMESEDMFYTGQRVCILPLELKKGKKAKVVFEQTYLQPEQFCEIILKSPYYVENAHYRINIPAELTDGIRINLFDIEPGTSIDSITETNGNKSYIITASAVAPLKSEPQAPVARLSAPRVVINAAFANYRDLYRFLYSHLWARTEADSDVVRTFAAEICKNAPTKRAEADSIAAWVQNNIRYIADEHNLYGLQPASALDVLDKRYGDCKGSAMLIRQLLKAREIDGRIVWIGTRGTTAYRWDQVPVPACANHMIAAAIIENDTLLLDGTAAYTPSGFVSPSLRGQLAMMEQDSIHCTLFQVPDNMVSDLDSISASFTLDDNGLSGLLSRTFTGGLKAAVANSYIRSDAAKRHKILEHLLTFPRKNCQLSDLSIVVGPPSDASVSISATTDEAGAVRIIGRDIYLDLKPIRDINSSPVELNDRTRGIFQISPYKQVSVFDILLPEGVVMKEVPENLVVDNPWFRAVINYSLNGNILNCESLMETKRLDATADEVRDWNRALKEVRAISDNQIVLTQTL